MSSGKNKTWGRWNGISELCKRWSNDKRVEREGRGFQAEEAAYGPEVKKSFKCLGSRSEFSGIIIGTKIPL